MKISRQSFLRITGLSLPGTRRSAKAVPPRVKGPRWAMAVDTAAKCARLAELHQVHRGLPPGAQRAAIPDPRARGALDLARSPSSVPSAARKTEYSPINAAPAMVLCNHCDNPRVRPRLPHPGHLEARRRHRDDGLASLHRLPLLHGGLPVRLAQFQLAGSAAVHP